MAVFMVAARTLIRMENKIRPRTRPEKKWNIVDFQNLHGQTICHNSSFIHHDREQG